MQMEKIIERIQNLMDLSNNNPNENEAIAAALKAQELMAKYHIEITDLCAGNTEDIVELTCDLSLENGNCKWSRALASIISRNFCCKHYILRSAGRADGTVGIVFYGYKKDTEIAKEVFESLFRIGNKLSRRCYYEEKKAERSTKGVMNTFLMGFCDGIKEALDKQCVALMIVTPKEVEDSYNKMINEMKFLKVNTKVNCVDNDNIKRSGVLAGRNAVERNRIAG